jgi:hypothetical protein
MIRIGLGNVGSQIIAGFHLIFTPPTGCHCPTRRHAATECPLVLSPLAPGWRIDLTSATPQG